MREQTTQVTHLLIAWRQGDKQALDELMPLVHDELRRLADRYLHRERSDHSLDPTELVHEAYLRLVGKTHPKWRDRAHFYAVAGQIMRRILVDHARGVQAAKRGGGAVKLPLEDADELVEQRATELIALDNALASLAAFDDTKARIIELRFFAGLTIEETAEVLGIATATVIKGARLARAYLRAEMDREPQAEVSP